PPPSPYSPHPATATTEIYTLSLHDALPISTARKGQVELEIADASGSTRTLVADHVIAATGYKVNLGRLAYLSPEIRARIHTIERSEEHTSELQSPYDLVCRLLLEKKKKKQD